MDVRADPSVPGNGVDPGLKALQAALDAMPIGVSWTSLADSRILYVNHAFTSMLGYTLEDLNNIEEWVAQEYPYADDVEPITALWQPYIKEGIGGPIAPMEVRLRCKNGEIKTVLHSGTILPESGRLLVTFVDITERKRVEMALHDAERQARENEGVYRLLLDNSAEMTVLASAGGAVLYVSPAVERITGFTAAEFLAAPWQEHLHAEDLGNVRDTLLTIQPGDAGKTIRYRIAQKGGGYRWVEGKARAFADPQSGNMAGYVTAIRDISEQKMREDGLRTEIREMSQAAALDEMTGIANRQTFNQRFEMEASRAENARMDLSMLMVDVDLFKQFNDLYGHMAGDECLKRLAETLGRTIQREGDLVARFGGEEFVVLLPGTNATGAARVARNIQDAVNGMGILHEESPHAVVTVSIGAATWRGGPPVDRDELLRDVDRALYTAKWAGRNRVCFAEDKRSQRAAESDQAA
jgi:diguanylate cyclase (GGDEF)-like protein/PAS domain S-box-containing protein